jgi:hypothetical protein
MSGRHVFGYYPLEQQPFLCPAGLEATQGFPGGSMKTYAPVSYAATRDYQNDTEGWIVRHQRSRVAGKGRK